MPGRADQRKFDEIRRLRDELRQRGADPGQFSPIRFGEPETCRTSVPVVAIVTVCVMLMIVLVR